ncbi:hypothetical protein [Streptomyces sp. SID13031]|uniref:hypothetical protein n=1 Tax=Streptomyces sp. SID13031 TaxID=2706046 RepID=UPI0013C57D76|nr:hypothetical protein [Streptomyces sp. SID13031]NEA31858.1 hypothetical protein [Streptomyces sp. SID13031]
MASIEEEVLQDLYRVFQQVREFSARLLRKRTPDLSRLMREARSQDNHWQLDVHREQERRSLVEDLQNERNHNPEFAESIDRLPDDQRTQRVEAEARWQQDQRDRMDADPNLTPEDIQREVAEQRDVDHNGLDDREDQQRQTEDDLERNVVDPNGNGEIDAVEQRQAAQAERDAEQARERERERNAEARETEEARGGDALPAVAAAGAGAVVAAEEAAEELEERQDHEALDDQQQNNQLLNDDGTTPPVLGEDAQQPGLDQDLGLDQDRDQGEPGREDRILDEDGAAPAVIGEDAQQSGLDQDGLDQDGPDQNGQGREGREGQIEVGEAGPQPGLPTGGDQAAAARTEDLSTERQPDVVDRALEDARAQNGQDGPGEQNGQNQIPKEELDRLRGFQEGQVSASEATRPRSGEPVEAGAGGKNPGARAAELRSEKSSKRDGPGIGE